MELHLGGKKAPVTGASMGIGRAIAKGLAAEGVKVCITARRRHLLEELAAEMSLHRRGLHQRRRDTGGRGIAALFVLNQKAQVGI